MSLLTQKQEFNTLMKRRDKACLLIDDDKIPVAQREKWVPEFKKILKMLDNLTIEIRESGYEMTDSEISEGFKEV